MSRAWVFLPAMALSLGALASPLHTAQAPLFSQRELRPAPPYSSQGLEWPWKPGTARRSAAVRADLGQPGPKLTRYHFGQNTSWWSRWRWSLDEDRLAKMRQAGLTFWRFPGGSSADFYFWNGDYGKYAKAYNGDDSARVKGEEYLDFDHFMELCARSGSEPILTLNYGLARYGSLKEAVDLATAWLRYAKAKGYAVHYVEVGNENYGNWEGGSEVPGRGRLSGEQYGKDFGAFAEALKAVDPAVKVGAVVVGDDGGDEWVGFRWWDRGVMGEVKDSADFLVVHEYFLWPFDQAKNLKPLPDDLLLGNVDRVAKLKANLDGMQDRYMHKRLPVALDEFNIVNGSPDVTIKAVNLAFTAGVLGEAASQGFATANIWDWTNGLDKKLGGDHGLLANDDPEVPKDTPRPSYYAYAIWQRAGGEELLHTEIVGPLRAYATRHRDGRAGWVLINGSDEPLDLRLDLKGYHGDGKVNAWCAWAPGLASKTIFFNDAAGPAGGGGPFPLDSLQPYVLQAKGGNLQLTLPPASVSALVFY